MDLSNHGVHGASLTQSQRAEYIDCCAKLAPYQIGLREAINVVLPMLAVRNRTVPVPAAVTELLEAKTKDGASRRHLEDLRSRLGQFARAFDERTLAGVAGPEIDHWLRSLSVTGLTRNHFRRVVGSLFAFGLLQGYCTDNPVLRLAKAKVISGRIGILTPEQTTRLLVNSPLNAVAPLAIAAFAGLRRAELERLDWQEIRLAKGLIEIRADKSKTARRRFIPIRPNLTAWLQPYARSSGTVCPSNWQKYFNEARQRAGLKGSAWPSNGLRHSFASYHAAHFQDAGKLAAELGHTTPSIVFQHYRELVEPETAEQYWQIRPATASSSLHCPRAANL